MMFTSAFRSAPTIPSVSLFSFFFHSHGHLRALHSFPTRRSSDLARRTFPSPPRRPPRSRQGFPSGGNRSPLAVARRRLMESEDRKSTRLNSSHVEISYAVFCLKKKKNT